MLPTENISTDTEGSVTTIGGSSFLTLRKIMAEKITAFNSVSEELKNLKDISKVLREDNRLLKIRIKLKNKTIDSLNAFVPTSSKDPSILKTENQNNSITLRNAGFEEGRRVKLSKEYLDRLFAQRKEISILEKQLALNKRDAHLFTELNKAQRELERFRIYYNNEIEPIRMVEELKRTVEELVLKNEEISKSVINFEAGEFEEIEHNFSLLEGKGKEISEKIEEQKKEIIFLHLRIKEVLKTSSSLIDNRYFPKGYSFKSFRKENEKLLNKISDYQFIEEETKNEIEGRDKKISDLEIELFLNKEKYKNLLKDNSLKEKEISKLKNEIHSMQEKLRSLNIQPSSSSDNTSEEFEKLKRDDEIFKADYEIKFKVISSLQMENSGLKERVQKFETKFSERNSYIQELEKENKNKVITIKYLNEEVIVTREKFDDKKNSTEKSLRSFKDKSSTLEKDLSKEKEKSSSYKDIIKNLEQNTINFESLKNTLKDYETEILEKDKFISEKEKIISRINAEYEILKSSKNNFSEENKHLKDKIKKFEILCEDSVNSKTIQKDKIFFEKDNIILKVNAENKLLIISKKDLEDENKNLKENLKEVENLKNEVIKKNKIISEKEAITSKNKTKKEPIISSKNNLELKNKILEEKIKKFNNIREEILKECKKETKFLKKEISLFENQKKLLIEKDDNCQKEIIPLNEVSEENKIKYKGFCLKEEKLKNSGSDLLQKDKKVEGLKLKIKALEEEKHGLMIGENIAHNKIRQYQKLLNEKISFQEKLEIRDKEVKTLIKKFKEVKTELKENNKKKVKSDQKLSKFIEILEVDENLNEKELFSSLSSTMKRAKKYLEFKNLCKNRKK